MFPIPKNIDIDLPTTKESPVGVMFICISKAMLQMALEMSLASCVLSGFNTGYCAAHES